MSPESHTDPQPEQPLMLMDNPQSFASMHANSSLVGPVRELLVRSESAALAIIVDVRGPSYRPIGAMMAIFSETERVGSLSSGCIEHDIALQAMRAQAEGHPTVVSYGEGSPYVDIRLPCGGGMDVLLLPDPDRKALQSLVEHHDARTTCTLVIDIQSGAMTTTLDTDTARHAGQFHLKIEPDILFNIFGSGIEASTFAALVQTVGYPGVLLSPDDATIHSVTARRFETRKLNAPLYPDDLETDEQTAVVMFFHDHDWEPPILAAALQTPAFYIGAQGSRRARNDRMEALAALGVSEDRLKRMKGPIGLIPSARDSNTLAVSVLAEILSVAMPVRD